MAELITEAEGLAKEATVLPEFRKINLAGVKDQIAEILGLIGKVDGIFSTYSKHDISHIDNMLRMLDWLVPPSTRSVMTPVDWLLTVLSIYLHDLGMFVTSAEYDTRMENLEFKNFLERLYKDPDAKDYLARAEAMGEDDKRRFFYQEYVRLHHASRIREWINGRHSRHWGEAIKPIANEIAKILEDLPPRFREHLAVVCESHHKDDLNRTDIYPVLQRYGNLPIESANVQYAAFLLRTADLIHVTKDRTPSVMYKTVAFSDLKSVDEWSKQSGTFSVFMRGRSFNQTDTDSHIIEVSADFSDERPFFALTEYIAWADSQIKQTKRWSDRSLELPDAKEFWFPWHSIKGDIRVEGNQPKQMRFELDRGRLLNLLVGHTIYNDATVALRELLQNAIDAVRFQFHLEQKSSEHKTPTPKMERVTVRWNPDTRELIVEDKGIGMSLDVIQNHLLRVGSSFYDTPQFQIENADFTPISRFGIGVLTCFMISDNIEIVTCSSQQARRIRMTSVHADYLLKDITLGDPLLDGIEPHGTRVRLILRPSVELNDTSVLDILRYWIILPECEVIYSEAGKDGQKIGFQSISEALEDAYFKRRGLDKSDHEVITAKPKELMNGEYELAFLVVSGLTPERSFVSRVEKGMTAVCIEGIRADSHLPGFSENFPALLSVRGNRKFRTTVSRSSLEVDEEYLKVAELCANALFDHVESEVRRIASLAGSPLSQASTAGQWLYGSLSSAAASNDIRPKLEARYQKLPLVVVEQMQNGGNALEDGRELISMQELSKISQLWTIESRIVDNLGVLSRDLGREVSIGSFLRSLAPELIDPRIDVVIPDVHLFDINLLGSHLVAEVEFSKKHQRTLLRWISRGRDNTSEDKIRFNPAILRAINELQGLVGVNIFRRGYYSDLQNLPYEIRRTINLITIAPVKGDVTGIRGVHTRLLTVVDQSNEIANLWEMLSDLLQRYKSLNLSHDEYAAVIMAKYILAASCSGMTSQRRTYYDEDDNYTRFIIGWRVLAGELVRLLEKQGIPFALSDKLESIVGGTRYWFDATSYWLNWSKNSEDDEW